MANDDCELDRKSNFEAKFEFLATTCEKLKQKKKSITSLFAVVDALFSSSSNSNRTLGFHCHVWWRRVNQFIQELSVRVLTMKILEASFHGCPGLKTRAGVCVMKFQVSFSRSFILNVSASEGRGSLDSWVSVWLSTARVKATATMLPV